MSSFENSRWYAEDPHHWPAVHPGEVLAVLQEGLGDEGGVEVAALQLRQQSVRVELPDLLQVAKDQVRPAEEGYIHISIHNIDIDIVFIT